MCEGRRLFHLTVALAGMSCAFAACHQSEQVQAARDPVLSQSDQHFVSETEQLANRDSALSAFVKGKSRSTEIKKYADTVTTDDSAALQKLDNAIEKYKVKEPSTAADRQTTEAPLKKLSRRALDQKFVSLLIQDDENAIGMFQEETRSQGDPDLRQYAVATLPAFQNDLKRAQELQTKLSPARAKKVSAKAKRNQAARSSF